MLIDIVFPLATEAFNGIGDHTRTLADELASRGHDVRVLHRGAPSSLTGYRLADGWPDRDLRNTRGLVESIVQRKSDAVLLQFEQFSYGTRGFNPAIARLFNDLGRLAPATRRVLFAHETYPDPDRPAKAVMWSYQRAQIRALAQASDVVLTSCSKVYNRLRGANPRIFPVPVHSNIPRAHADRATERQRLGLADELAVMVFGHLDSTRARWISAAFADIAAQTDARLLYVGKASAAASALTGDEPGRLIVVKNATPIEVSSAMGAADLALAPFRDGVSGRRGSFAAYMDHEVPTVTNLGDMTDEYLSTAAAAGAFRLATGLSDFQEQATALALDSDLRAQVRSRIPASFSYIPSLQATADAVEVASDVRRTVRPAPPRRSR